MSSFDSYKEQCENYHRELIANNKELAEKGDFETIEMLKKASYADRQSLV